MTILLTSLHVLVCLFLIIVVLLQSGKAADLAGAFGGMGSQTAFGPRGAATVLSKATTIAAAVFMINSLALSVVYTRQGGSGGGASVLEKAKPTGQTPAAPVTSPAGKAATPVVPDGQPSVTFKDPQTGQEKTVPVTLPPEPTKGAPAKGAPAKKQ